MIKKWLILASLALHSVFSPHALALPSQPSNLSPRSAAIAYSVPPIAISIAWELGKLAISEIGLKVGGIWLLKKWSDHRTVARDYHRIINVHQTPQSRPQGIQQHNGMVIFGQYSPDTQYACFIDPDMRKHWGHQTAHNLTIEDTRKKPPPFITSDQKPQQELPPKPVPLPEKTPQEDDSQEGENPESESENESEHKPEDIIPAHVDGESELVSHEPDNNLLEKIIFEEIIKEEVTHWLAKRDRKEELAHTQKALSEQAKNFSRSAITSCKASLLNVLNQKLKEFNIVLDYALDINEMDMEHIMFGGYNPKKKRLTGLHSIRWCPHKIKTILIAPGKLGTWQGVCHDPTVTEKVKDTTLFPDNWDEKKIIEKIIESLWNITKIENRGDAIKIFCKTEGGIRLEVLLNKEGCITTAYPALRYEEELCIY